MEINSLVPDIYALVQSKKGWFDEQTSDALRTSLASRLSEHFNSDRKALGSGHLRMSGLGERCPRALWYSVHHPEMAEDLPPWAEIKFAYGHILEELALTLARAAGHHVIGEQDELTLDGILGHRDGVVDGCVVDVKSCSSIAFSKFKSRSIEQSDSFGYLDQLSSYLVASVDDPLVQVKDRGYILAIDKTLGHMYLYEHRLTEEKERKLRERIIYYKEVVNSSNPPPCECRTQPHGTTGNIKLAVPASYSSFKHCCYPNLRTFLYSDGPTYLTKVTNKPNVTEIDRFGRFVY